MKILGNRIVKTALAVFLTALICQLIGWPPVFAVITAIVTLEPTVADSIKKGLVRFPASAIGSFYAVLFIALFGNSPITYTLAATLTIITSYRLKLHAGLLVATITAVAMIEVVHDNYFLSFFIRLGTTSIGIVVSTLVNLLIFPPNYMKEIDKNLTTIYENIAHTLQFFVEENNNKFDRQLTVVSQQLSKTDELVRFQTDEFEFHRPLDSKRTQLVQAQAKNKRLHFLHYHVNNLKNIHISSTLFREENKQLITEATNGLAEFMLGDTEVKLHTHEYRLRNLMRLYFHRVDLPKNIEVSKLPNEIVLLYELISLFHLVKQYEMLIERNDETTLA